MNERGKKLEPKLGINMPFSELMQRILQTDPKEVEASVERAKQKETFSPLNPKRKARDKV